MFLEIKIWLMLIITCGQCIYSYSLPDDLLPSRSRRVAPPVVTSQKPSGRSTNVTDLHDQMQLPQQSGGGDAPLMATQRRHRLATPLFHRSHQLGTKILSQNPAAPPLTNAAQGEGITLKSSDASVQILKNTKDLEYTTDDLERGRFQNRKTQLGHSDSKPDGRRSSATHFRAGKDSRKTNTKNDHRQNDRKIEVGQSAQKTVSRSEQISEEKMNNRLQQMNHLSNVPTQQSHRSINNSSQDHLKHDNRHEQKIHNTSGMSDLTTPLPSQLISVHNITTDQLQDDLQEGATSRLEKIQRELGMSLNTLRERLFRHNIPYHEFMDLINSGSPVTNITSILIQYDQRESQQIKNGGESKEQTDLTSDFFFTENILHEIESPTSNSENQFPNQVPLNKQHELESKTFRKEKRHKNKHHKKQIKNKIHKIDIPDMSDKFKLETNNQLSDNFNNKTPTLSGEVEKNRTDITNDDNRIDFELANVPQAATNHESPEHSKVNQNKELSTAVTNTILTSTNETKLTKVVIQIVSSGNLSEETSASTSVPIHNRRHDILEMTRQPTVTHPATEDCSWSSELENTPKAFVKEEVELVFPVRGILLLTSLMVGMATFTLLFLIVYFTSQCFQRQLPRHYSRPHN